MVKLNPMDNKLPTTNTTAPNSAALGPFQRKRPALQVRPTRNLHGRSETHQTYIRDWVRTQWGDSDRGIVRELPGASPPTIRQNTRTSPTRTDPNHPRRWERSLRHLHQSEGKAPRRFPVWVSGPIVRGRRTSCGGSLRLSAEYLNTDRVCPR